MLQTWSRGATTNGCQYKCITYLPSCEAMGWSQAPPRCCNQRWPCKMQSCLMGVTCSPQGVPLLSHCCPTQNGKLTDRRLWPIRPTLLIPWCYWFVIAGTHGEAAQLFLAQVVAIRYPELLGSLNWSELMHSFKWRMEWIWMEQFKTPRRLFLAATYDDGLTKIWSPSSFDWAMDGPWTFPMQWHFEFVNTINFMMTYWSLNTQWYRKNWLFPWLSVAIYWWPTWTSQPPPFLGAETGNCERSRRVMATDPWATISKWIKMALFRLVTYTVYTYTYNWYRYISMYY